MADPRPVAAIVGAESLMGRELRELLEPSGLVRVKLISAEEQENAEGAILSEQEGEAVFMTSLRAGELSDARMVFLAGPPSSAAQVVQSLAAETNAPALIDATGALEDNPAARLRAPMAEDPGAGERAAVTVIAHPAAIVLAIFLRRLSTAGTLRRVVAQIFEPVSERGQKGLDELQQQTVGLLSFQKLRKEIFDTQVSFNLLPQYGEEAVKSLDDVESTIDRHLATLLSVTPQIPLPSINLAHAPVFHGYTFSIWAEFESRPALEGLAAGLATPQIEVRAKDEEAPSNVGAAGQSGITVGAIHPDRNDPRAYWFWVVADNLRIVAENAVEVARELAA